MSTRASDLPFDAVRVPAEALGLKRATLWALLASKIVTGWGVQWDIQWHVLIGRDSFWIPPHLITYAGVSAAVFLSFGVLFWETWRGTGGVRVLGLRGSRGFQLAAWGMAVTIIAAPIDDLWHRLFGLDVTLWSPPHLLGILGGLVASVACLVIAREVYPSHRAARWLGMVLAGMLLYRGLALVAQPAFLLAHAQGGLWFHAPAILSAILLPLALVVTAMLTGWRWSPAAVVVAALLTGAVGQRVADTGFDLLQPVSVIDEEVAKDPTSPVANAVAIARQNGTPPGRSGLAELLVSLLAALAMVAVDARRRPAAAGLAYGMVLFALMGWMLAGAPAFASMRPDIGLTVVACAITALAALASGRAGHALAAALGADSR